MSIDFNTAQGMYVLDNEGNPVAEHDIDKWSRWFENKDNRIVKQENVGNCRVSTVFLGVDHSHGETEPVLWETLVLGGIHDGNMNRCSGNIKNAMKMHRNMVRWVRRKK